VPKRQPGSNQATSPKVTKSPAHQPSYRGTLVVLACVASGHTAVALPPFEQGSRGRSCRNIYDLIPLSPKPLLFARFLNHTHLSRHSFIRPFSSPLPTVHQVPEESVCLCLSFASLRPTTAPTTSSSSFLPSAQPDRPEHSSPPLAAATSIRVSFDSLTRRHILARDPDGREFVCPFSRGRIIFHKDKTAIIFLAFPFLFGFARTVRTPGSQD
jgi:hypothetical protein